MVTTNNGVKLIDWSNEIQKEIYSEEHSMDHVVFNINTFCHVNNFCVYYMCGARMKNIKTLMREYTDDLSLSL